MGRLETALGLDVLVLAGFQGQDRMNGLFDYEVDCVARNEQVDFDALLGTHATVFIRNRAGEDQPFDGLVTEVRWMGQGDHGDRFRLRLQPWFHLASLRRNQRIFHERTPNQILQEVLGAYSGAGKMTDLVTTAHPVLEYTVQYRESDLEFACRIMQRFGISYHFEHRTGEHDMVLTDRTLDHDTIGTRPFKPHEGRQMDDIGHFNTWHPANRITTGAIRMTDYNFKAPVAAMESDYEGDAAHAHGKLESYDYPGLYLDQSKGEHVVKLRSDQERGQGTRFAAQGDVISLRAGRRVTLGGDQIQGHGEDFLCLTAQHIYRTNAYRSGGDGGSEEAYEGHYTFLPAEAPMLPEIRTRQAVVQGPQTATVVGDGEIDCDEYGRILVHFPWDLAKAYSMRCRVSQNWAGNGWGGMVIPRIGMEVVVEFLEGDPDKPLVTGCVYNGKNDPPYELPAHKTRSTFRTDTHQGEGFNELRFEDEKGKEEIFLHAQKDRNTKVENNQSERVNVNKVESIGHDKASEVGNTWLQVAGGDFQLRVGPGNVGTVTPSGAAENDQGLPTLPERFGKLGSNAGAGDMDMSIERNKIQKIGVDHNETVGKDKISTVGNNYSATVTNEVEIIAGSKITLQAGMSRITMEDNGTISVDGNTLNVNMAQLIKMLASMVKIN
ncbi:type VI secretion system Vgr family protein [Aliiroseovarius sp.]|uniref:type VI secretion system Vgr family protein n=1 Tax=Aliiroseovarius sp. TaxID=1872442 RepID=UPI003BAA336D